MNAGTRSCWWLYGSWFCAAFSATCTWAWPATAYAHSPITGMGDVVNGLVHPLVTPAHVLCMLGLGLLLGQQSPLQLKLPLLIFAPALALALLATGLGFSAGVAQTWLHGLALLLGILVALARPLPPIAAAVLSLPVALAIGLDSGLEPQLTGKVLQTLLGTWLAVTLVVFDVAYYASQGRRWKWLQTGFRIIGSWLAAISLLLLAFAFKR